MKHVGQQSLQITQLEGRGGCVVGGVEPPHLAEKEDEDKTRVDHGRGAMKHALRTEERTERPASERGHCGSKPTLHPLHIGGRALDLVQSVPVKQTEHHRILLDHSCTTRSQNRRK